MTLRRPWRSIVGQELTAVIWNSRGYSSTKSAALTRAMFRYGVHSCNPSRAGPLMASTVRLHLDERLGDPAPAAANRRVGEEALDFDATQSQQGAPLSEGVASNQAVQLG